MHSGTAAAAAVRSPGSAAACHRAGRHASSRHMAQQKPLPPQPRRRQRAAGVIVAAAAAAEDASEGCVVGIDLGTTNSAAAVSCVKPSLFDAALKTCCTSMEYRTASLLIFISCLPPLAGFCDCASSLLSSSFPLQQTASFSPHFSQPADMPIFHSTNPPPAHFLTCHAAGGGRAAGGCT